MTRKTEGRGRIIPLLFFTFAAGASAGWWARSQPAPLAPSRAAVVRPTGTTGDTRVSAPPVDAPHATVEMERRGPGHAEPDTLGPLAARDLRLPVDGASIDAMKGQFAQSRDRGARGHEAVDILAPRNTPVHAVDDGTIARLFFSKLGGITVYQFDPTRRYCYYYAHLERYAPNLHESQTVARGDVLGYVGTSGNAPPGTPHLHFAIFELTPEQRWWEGRPIDPWSAYAQ